MWAPFSVRASGFWVEFDGGHGVQMGVRAIGSASACATPSHELANVLDAVDVERSIEPNWQT